MIRTLGLSGLKGSGKDTLFEILNGSLPWVFKRDAFADRLKLSAYRCFNPEATLEQAVGWCNSVKQDGVWVTVSDPRYGTTDSVTGREFLQHYGTEAHRDVFDKDFWVNALPLTPPDGVDVLVITDCRFPNEAEAILAQPDSAVIEIVRDGLTSDGHASEQPLPRELVTATVYNNGTLDDLANNALYLWEVLAGEGINV